MNRREFLQNTSLLLASTRLSPLQAQHSKADSAQKWMNDFADPPDAAYPWVYSFWLNGNVTKEGISADLEAMHQAGIRGMLFMDGAVGNPPGPDRFMSEAWLEMFDHMLAEADRLGIEFNLNNDPGWAGSGGPWVTPEIASQRVITAAMILQGPSRFDGTLTPPAGVNHGYYRDIAVVAYPLPANGVAPSFRIPDFDSTKSFAGGHDFFGVVPWPRFIPTSPEWPAVPADQCVQAAKMVDLTGKMGREGHLSWEVPAGHWIVLRFGHTVANGATRSVQEEAKGLECDKLSKRAAETHFSHMVGKLTERVGPLAGKTLISTHIDSWEAGSGNWTDGFREEFHRRRGYDLLPLLPALNGIVVDNREVSERFLWDYRETVCELLLENYAGHFRELARSKGLRLSIEGYDATCDDLRYAGRADEPMTEFWRSVYNGLPLSDLTEGMASAAHVYGKPIVAAEACTSFRGDFLDHPATLKPLADWAFCTGVNRFCFSEWILQPWPHLVPGVSFSQFGTVFHRAVTWWAQSKPWHEYIARCQYMLRQGQFIADICFVVPEGGPYRFTPPVPATTRGVIPDRPEYNFDGCPAELVIQGMKVQDGKVILPSGMKYQLLVLPTYNAQDLPVIRLMDQDDYFYKAMPMPQVQTMTPELLGRIKELVEAGATVLGKRPVKSPSLATFPECDNEVTRLADELWGKNAGATGTGEHRVGKGRVVWGSTPEQVLAGMEVPPDFACSQDAKQKLNYTHRQTADGRDIYFVVNKQAAFLQASGSFRVAGKQPELYWPQSGRIEPMIFFEERDGVTTIPLSLNANESVFVVFRQSDEVHGRIVSIERDGEKLWPKTAVTMEAADADDSFMMAAWVRGGSNLVLPEENGSGWAYAHDDVQVPGFGYQTFTAPGQGRGGFAVGSNGIVVYQFSESGSVEPLLVYAAPIRKSIHVGVIYQNRIPRLFINGKLVKTGSESRFPRYGSAGWEDKRPFAGEVAALAQFDEMLRSGGMDNPAEALLTSDPFPAIDFSHGNIWKPGTYVLKTVDGKSWRIAVHLPAQEIIGPWQVQFDPRWGGPANVTFEKLQDWSTHSEEGIRYYSGTATYRTVFKTAGLPVRNPSSKTYLDLGKVAVMADVTLNGKNLGILWNLPYRVDVTEAIESGENTLEVKIVNVWVNRMIGDEQLPEDSDRDENGEVKAWPQWVLEGKASPTGRFTFASRRQWSKGDPLVQSGLLGPVKLLMSEKL